MWNQPFHQILDALADMVLVKGPKSKLLWANKAFCDYYGMSNEQLQGLIDAPFNEPDFTQQYVIDDAKVFESGQVLDIPMEPVTRWDGEVRYFHTIKAPIFDGDRKVVMTVGISRDITERLNVQKSLEEERSRSLYSAKMAALGEMAGGVAHEINNPLTAIKILSGQLHEIFGDGLQNSTLVKSMVKQIEATTDRIAKIVQGLRSFSRDGSRDPFQTVEVTQLIEETISFCSERFKVHGVSLKFDPPARGIAVEGRATEISQVLLNLLNNAYDAITDLGEKWIRISVVERDDCMEIRVADSGPGVPAELREKIFQPFFSTKDIGKGTGLGLSISSGIVRKHGGELFLDPQSPTTCFVIRLPKESNATQRP